ncbi:hypothetical protein [Streptomyces sp. NPDC007206]|uniref:hypothetical protein n=1 Tax=Streptomyces sp. NPDC007206 TaxID=3154317 RepID=UPI0033E166E9
MRCCSTGRRRCTHSSATRSSPRGTCESRRTTTDACRPIVVGTPRRGDTREEQHRRSDAGSRAGLRHAARGAEVLGAAVRPAATVGRTGRRPETGCRSRRDGGGHLTRRTAPDGNAEIWTYVGEGNCTSHTDPLGGVTPSRVPTSTCPPPERPRRGALRVTARDGTAPVAGHQPTDPDLELRVRPSGALVAETGFDGHPHV